MAKDSKKIPGVTGKDIKNTLIPMLDTLDDINEGATATITVDDRASKPLKNIHNHESELSRRKVNKSEGKSISLVFRCSFLF